jgi:general secretion pathway protein B
MSYILDALKKSEQERGQGSIPNVQTIHSSSLNYGNEKNRYWPYILTAAVLLNLLAISYFIFDKEKSLNTRDPLTPIELSVTTQSSNNPATEETIEEIAIEKNRKSTKKSHSVNTTKIEKASENKPKQNNNIDATLSTKTKTITKTKSHSGATDRLIIDYYDLSDSIKNKLPEIIVSAHVYSTNHLQRSIVINNDFMEEGEYISNDFMLHEITKDGAVFDYEGKLINYSVVSKWQ